MGTFDAVFLDGGGSGFSSRPYAEQTQEKIDGEVSRLLLEAEGRATIILSEHRDVLDRLVEMLVAKEKVDGTVVYQLAGRPYPNGASPRIWSRRPMRPPRLWSTSSNRQRARAEPKRTWTARLPRSTNDYGSGESA